MLALGRALVLKPQLLLLDEPSLGLGPQLVRAALEVVQRLAHERSMGVLIAEQKVREVLAIGDRVYVLKRGRVVFHGIADELARDEEKLRATYL